MSKLKRIIKINKDRRQERGQVLVIVAFALVGIIAIVGLVMDVGMMFVGNARLRRATDAAALAAALQYREGVQTDELTRAATEFLQLNGVILDSGHPVTVDTCATVISLCTDPATGDYEPRKLVRVHVSATVDLAFLPVIGLYSVPITAEATSETASLDLVLALDTSESMTFDALKLDDPGYDPNVNVPWELRDPSICNDDQKSINAINADDALTAGQKAAIVTNINTDGMPGECHPFEEVKQAAVRFVDRLYYPYDRVSVVTFDKSAHPKLQFDGNCTIPGGCTTAQIKATIENAIKNLTVYEAEGVCDQGQPCRPYCTQENVDDSKCDADNPDNFLQPNDANAVYKGVFDCGNGWHFDPIDPLDPSQCTTTDIGDGLMTAGNEYGVKPRQGSLWVTVVLTDGSANGGPVDAGEALACPSSTWNPQNGPLCRDSSSNTRHCGPYDAARCILNGNGLPIPDNSGGYVAGFMDSNRYDADDYARDMADYVGIDQGALIFTIGLGKQVGLPTGDPAGERLLQYAAEKAGGGLYFFAPQTTQLDDIFKKIGDNIAIRLAR